MITCHFCGHQVKPSEYGVHQWTAGWVKLRVGGGGHGIALAERAAIWAHGACVERRAQGYVKEQTSLFDAIPPPKREPGPTNAAFDGNMLIHVCNVCGADAPYGVGVAVKDGDLGLWFCKEHRPWCEVA
jgi:ribosomal protein L24E